MGDKIDADVSTDAEKNDTGSKETESKETGSPALPEWDGKVESLPLGAQKMIERLNNESASQRSKAKSAEDEAQSKIDAVLTALGIKADGDPVEAAKAATATAQSERDAAVSEARAAKIATAVYKAAAKHKGDAEAMLDSKSFEAELAELDPSAADFGTRLDSIVKSAVDSNRGFKATGVAGSGTADHSGGDAGGTVTLERFKKMSYAERVRLYETNPTLYTTLSDSE